MELSPEALAFLQFILEAIPSLGIGGVFLYLFMRERKHSEEMSKALLEAYKGGIAAQVEVKNAIDNNTRAIDRNTETVRMLMERNQ